MTEDAMVGWHHRLNGHEFQQTPGDDGQGGLACRSPWGCRVRHNLGTEQQHAMSYIVTYLQIVTTMFRKLYKRSCSFRPSHTASCHSTPVTELFSSAFHGGDSEASTVYKPPFIYFLITLVSFNDFKCLFI